MVIDYDTPSGKLRMRLGDTSDFPYLSDSIYDAVYAECDDNINKATINCGKMILAQMSYKTRRSAGLQLEVFGNQAFEQMKQFLLLTIKDPAFMDISPIPYSSEAEFSAIQQFQSDWNKCYSNGTQSQTMATDALNSPNDGSLYGPTGGDADGWDLT